MTLGLSRRSPGNIPRLGFPPTEADIVALNKFLKKLAEVTQGFPQHHNETHMQPASATGGNADSVSGTGTPTEIDFDTAGSEGDARLGFAPFNHKHPASDGLAELEPLSGVSTEGIDGKNVAYVYDPEGAELLTLIVLELQELLNDNVSNG